LQRANGSCLWVLSGGALLAATRLVIEVAVEAQDVGMAQVRLDLNLAAQLVLHRRLLQLALRAGATGAAAAQPQRHAPATRRLPHPAA
jgi:hypothetical protein